MNYILSDLNQHKKFLPLSFTRSIADFRAGILTIKEKWEVLLNAKIHVKTEDYLQVKYKLNIDSENIVINSALIPDTSICDTINSLRNSCLIKDGNILAYNFNQDFDNIPENKTEYAGDVIFIKSNTDLFSLNGELIKRDFDLITNSRTSQNLSNTNIVFGKFPVFVEDGCFVECVTINTNDGPVYIGKNAKIMEGTHIRGPFAICENSEIKMGAKIYGPTTIGP
ncbi:MAG: putative sugar nucleotidyl transferase, partial [Bacteroidales bacterium]|nr:putative sugar nucleotidyl transferase [Bacteroidales bacterium]